jgi:plasmid stability protein
MKNITLTVPEDVYRAARIRAAEAGTSVSALVGKYLRELTGRAAEFERLALRQQQIQNEIERFRAGDRLGRGAVHERAVR